MAGKIWKWLGLADVDEEQDDREEQTQFMFNPPANKAASIERPGFMFDDETKTDFNLPAAAYTDSHGVNIAVIQPQHFEDSQRAVDYIKRNQQVILDCSLSTPDISRRVIDFLSGAVYAVNGQAKPIGNGVFIFVPANTDVTLNQ